MTSCEIGNTSKNPARDLVDSELAIDNPVAEEVGDDLVELAYLSDDEGADDGEEDGNDSDVDSDAVSVGAEKAMTAAGWLNPLERRGKIVSRPLSSEPTDPEGPSDLETPTGQEPHVGDGENRSRRSALWT